MIQAISQSFNTESGQEAVTAEDGIRKNGDSFASSLDKMMNEEQHMAQPEISKSQELLEDGLLEGMAVPFSEEMLVHRNLETEMKTGEKPTRSTGLTLLHMLQNPLLQEQGISTKAWDGTVKGDATLSAAEPNGFLKETDLQFSDLPENQTGDLRQKQDLIQHRFHTPEAAMNESELSQFQAQEEQLRFSGQYKPETEARSSAEARTGIRAEETIAAFEMNLGSESFQGLQGGASRNNQTQFATRAEGPQGTNFSVESADLPFDVEQVMSRVRVLRENDSQQITLRLQPDHLGQLTMKVRQTGGELRVDMQVENLAAKQVIESSFDTLRSRFLEQEFNYKELSLHIDVDHRSGSENQRDAQQTRFGEEYASARSESAEEEILPRTYYHVTSNGNDSELNIYV